MKYLILSLATFLVGFVIGQDFDHYTTLSSQGNMPDDWTVSTFEKIEQDRKAHPELYKNTSRREFLEKITYGVDEMVHSGDVVYGDPISKYAESIAKRLLADEPEVFNQLRFYTIKSNVTNALSTREGIIFVTTGLVSQLANEAQLAFVLAHEISHYKREHILDKFEFNKKKSNYYSLEKNVQFSQNHELEADADGIKMYHKAGYSVDELINTFDVLMYSYLPFDEIAFDINFMTSGKLTIPNNYFPKSNYPITAYEDYDDELSSHPNIKKRKDAGLKIVADISNWGNTIYFEGEQTFATVRNIARFESIRTDILNQDMGPALYSIYLLQKDGQFKDSHYLNASKAYAWYGIARLTRLGSKAKTIPNKKDFEGESAYLYHLISSLPKEAIPFIALRNIYDVYATNPNDSLIIKMVSDFSKDFISAKTDRISYLKAKSMAEAEREYLLKKDSIAKTGGKDTVIAAASTNSKYDRIKTKKTEQAQGFDTTKFYTYGFADVLADNTFLSYLKQNEKAIEEESDSTITDEELKEILSINSGFQTGANNKIYLIEPTINLDTKGNTNAKVKAHNEAVLEEMLIESIQLTAVENGTEVETLTSDQIYTSANTANLNERNLILSNLKSVGDNSTSKLIPFDYELLDSISMAHKTDIVTFYVMDQNREPDFHGGAYVSSILFPLVIPFLLAVDLPYCIMTVKRTEISYMQMNIKTGEVLNVGRNYITGKLNRMAIENCVHYSFK